MCANFAVGVTNAYLIHIAAGVDQTALNEFDDLSTAPTTAGCLFAPQTAIIHGTARGATEAGEHSPSGHESCGGWGRWLNLAGVLGVHGARSSSGSRPL